MKHFNTTGITAGLVGIWWYTQDKDIWSYRSHLNDGVESGYTVQYSVVDNHDSLWKLCVRDNADPALFDKIYNEGYKCYERGRVIFNTKTCSYEVLCTNKLVDDIEFRRKIKQVFELAGCEVDFIAMDRYSPVSRTGEPAIDEFYGY